MYLYLYTCNCTYSYRYARQGKRELMLVLVLVPMLICIHLYFYLCLYMYAALVSRNKGTMSLYFLLIHLYSSEVRAHVSYTLYSYTYTRRGKERM